MEKMGQVDIAYPAQQRRFAVTEPIVDEDGDSVTLQFRIGEIQSEMSKSDPNFLALSYTRTMTDFMLFNKEPERIAIIGLGGGSMPKWCFHALRETDITVIEINPKVISLRDRFYIPADDHRFRIICEDGADYVASTQDSPEVLLVDGFDLHGQPPQLCSQQFYDDCYRTLAPNGLLVVNLCGPGDEQLLYRIRRSFDGRVVVTIPRKDGYNRVVFALKGEHLSVEPDHRLIPSLVQA